MKGDRGVKRWRLAVFAGIVLSCSAAVRADIVQVSATVPWFPEFPQPSVNNVFITFDWNTANGRIYNMDITSNVPGLASALVWPAGTKVTPGDTIWVMGFGTGPNGNFLQIDSDLYSPPQLYYIHPQPGTYTVAVDEACIAPFCTAISPTYTGDVSYFRTPTVTVSELHGNPHFADPVATPEPATIVLGGSALLLLLVKSLRRF
jgi:hypothetical protein